METTTLVEKGPGAYSWKSAPIGETAELLTLQCRGCAGSDAASTVPLVSVLRDTLGDTESSNDRISYVWLLGAPHAGVGQKALAAVPFFFWRVGRGSDKLTKRDLGPQVNLTSPQDPMLTGIARQLVQWTALDPLTTWVRASSRTYQSNASDSSRFQIEQTISYLRHAPTSDGPDGLTQAQLKTVIARLELRKTFLGGLVGGTDAAKFADESAFEDERVRSRNWELLRQCAEKTGLLFESTDLGAARGQYAMLWFPADGRAIDSGTSPQPIYKLLNIRDPWSDARLRNWDGLSVTRSVDDLGRLLPAGDSGSGTVPLIPLGLYSLNYPKMPLLLVDFRDKLHVRRHEMTQRSINQITAGVIGLSRIANWYYYVGAMAYNFVSSRHGTAVSQADRLDCYSNFRAQLALDTSLDAKLHNEIARRAESLTVSPLDDSERGAANRAEFRYRMLLAMNDDNSALSAKLNRDRRAELAAFGESSRSSVLQSFYHLASFGLYTHRVNEHLLELGQLDRERRFAYHLGYLDQVAKNGTQPEVAFDAQQIQSSIADLGQLVESVQSPVLREHATGTLSRIAGLSHDSMIQADCRQAMLALANKHGSPTPLAAVAAEASTRPAPSVPVAGPISGLR